MDNILGTVQIEIRGDFSKLQGDFAAAGQIAVRAGSQISQGIGQGADGADKVVVAIGRLAGIIQQESAAASLAWQRNIATLGAYQRSVQAVEASVRQVGAAHGAVVPQMTAVSGAIRTAFGEQSIRAVERFVTLIPGVGAALQAAFPIIGAIALAEALDRVIDKVVGLKAAEENLKEATSAADESLKKLSDTANRLTVKDIGAGFGKAASAAAQLRLDTQELAKAQEDLQNVQDAKRIAEQAAGASFGESLGVVVKATTGHTLDVLKKNSDAIKALGKDAQAASDRVQELQDKIGSETKEAARTSQEEGGSAGAASAANRVRAVERETEARKKAAEQQIAIARTTAEAQIKAIEDAGDREVAEANLKVTTARASELVITSIIQQETQKRIAAIQAEGAARAAGKSKPEQGIIGIETQGKVRDAAAQADEQRKELHAKTLDAIAAKEEANADAARKFWEESNRRIAEDTEKRLKETSLDAETVFRRGGSGALIDIEAEHRAAGITAKGTGQEKDLEIEGKKIALENEYAGLLIHTSATNLEYVKEIAALDAQARQAKLDGLKADLADAESIAHSVKGTEEYIAALEKVANLKNQVANLEQENANAAAKSAGQIQSAARADDLGRQIGEAFSQAVTKTLPEELGRGLAGAVFGDGKRGHDFGHATTSALEGTGKNLLSTAFDASLKKLISVIVAQTGLQAAFNAIFGTGTTALTTATVASTAAHVASTAATVTNAGVTAANAAAVTANTVASAANTIALALNTAALVADTTALYIDAVSHLFGFDKGGPVPQDMIAQVHGGEWVLNKDQVAGRQALPPHIAAHANRTMLAAVGGGNAPHFNIPTPSQTGSGGATVHHFNGPMNFYGVQNVRQMMRGIADFTKSQSPQFSNYAR